MWNQKTDGAFRHQKKIAMVNDLSGYGRCSLAAALPVISSMGIQCCPVPTSILSNHTGFPVWFFDDYTSKMKPYLEKWKELDLAFDGIVTGFLGSAEQISIVSDMIRDFKKKDTLVIVDPIMGDHGKTYSTYTPQMCREMERLVRLADAVTPNVTEGCILTGREYRTESWKRKELEEMAEEIRKMGPSSVVITGVGSPKSITNVIAEEGKTCRYQRNEKIGKGRPGTGDIFAALTAGALVKGWGMEQGVKLAAWFVKECIKLSEEKEIPVANGVCFEELLGELIGKCRKIEGKRAFQS